MPQSSLAQVLADEAPVGRDLLAIDWATHPLGPMEGWPQALANMVRILVGSRFSMWMAWGPELTFFCNDAYRRDTLGKKYPWALGQPAQRVWEEIWPDIGPRIAQVLRTGTATWDEQLLLFLERSGYLEETYHTFSYSPIPGDSGEVEGMLCVVTEDTERVIGERRMRTLRDLGSSTLLAGGDVDVLTAAAGHLADNPYCLPFTAIYLFEDDGSARRVASTGAPEGHPAVPLLLPAGDDGVWPVSVVAAGKEAIVEGADTRWPDLPTGAWQRPPSQVALVPLTGHADARPFGFLVTGINQHRSFDEEYHGFVRLVAAQLAAGIAASRTYEAERRRAEALAELDRAKTTFFTNVSHEFRTPLTLLLGPAAEALADREQPLPPRHRERLELVQRNALRMLKLVDSLLDFSRLESGRVRAVPEPLDLGHYTADLAAMFRPAFAAAGIELVVDVDRAETSALADPEMWAKIVLNLLSNALKHTFTGRVTVSCRGMADGVVLTVADTGIGIPEHEQPKLFQRFHRVQGAASRSHEGSGIGLALVAELVQLHGGAVAVRSVPEQGSTFVVTVPRGAPTSAGPAGAAGPAGPAAPAADGRRDPTAVARRHADGFVAEALRWKGTAGRDVTSHEDREDGEGGGAAGPRRHRVLIVDDNADMRDYLVSMLADSYRLQTAADGREALAAVAAQRPDLILTDAMMPGLDGFGLLEVLRKNPRTTDIPVVMLSARAGDEAVVEGLEAGADDYVVKPFTAGELRARLRSALELNSTRRSAAELRRSRALLDQAQRLAGLGSWQYDLAAGTFTVSDELARQLGTSVEDLAALGPQEAIDRFCHPEDAATLRGVLDAARGGEPFVVEVRTRLADGTVRLHRVIGEPVHGPDGRPVLVRGSSQDITEQQRTVALQAAAAAAREAASRENALAQELQLSLLPPPSFERSSLRAATFYRAGVDGVHVGGDWYDIIELGAARTALVIGDVMGRGVPAAAVMGQLRSAVRAFARLDLPPADLLELLDGLVRDLGEDQIVTCVYAVYDRAERTLTYANAGHLPPLVVPTDGPPYRLLGNGPPLGAGPFTLTEIVEELSPGAVVALYTDGLVERRDIDIEQGIDALAEALARHAAFRPDSPASIAADLLPDGPDDDIAVLMVKADQRPAPGSALTWLVDDDPAAVAVARSLVDDALRSWAVPAPLAEEVVLVVSELVTNAVLHARPPARLDLRRVDDELIVEVHDRAPFLPRKLRPGPDDEHGRGLQLVAHLALRWGTRPTRDGKAVWCVFRLPRPDAGTGAIPVAAPVSATAPAPPSSAPSEPVSAPGGVAVRG